MLRILNADLSSSSHADATMRLLNAYALDIAGGGAPLDAFVQANLIRELARRDTAHVVLALVDAEPAGLIICIEGFSTFACRPLLNIHDLMVAPAYRGQGIAKKMLSHVEGLARERGCCKLTLEGLEGNAVARKLYLSCGYAGYTLDPAMGHALFWQKELTPVAT